MAVEPGVFLNTCSFRRSPFEPPVCRPGLPFPLQIVENHRQAKDSKSMSYPIRQAALACNG